MPVLLVTAVTGVKFGLLGPIQVLDGQRAVQVPAGRVRALLAVLLLRANQVTSAERLAEYLGEHSSGTLRPSAVHTYVGRLRRVLGQQAGARLLRTTSSGYLIDIGPEQLDLTRFRQLVDQASATDEPAGRAALLTSALALWRGQPMADVGPDSLLAAESVPLQEERTHALERLMDARLLLGQHAEIVPDLTRLCHEHPLREQFWAQLMLAYYRCGRQAEALRAYRAIARLLADELGVAPGARLRQVQQAILVADPMVTDTPVGWRPQCQLPPSPAGFVGRRSAAAWLAIELRSTSTVPIIAVCGPPGVGKTALAVQVAHRLRPSFPDGQWYARLTEPDGTPRDPAGVLAELLVAGGIRPSALPTGLDQRSVVLRAALADRRVLLVLDDAVDASQVRPLLPGTAGNAVLITSSRDLTPLIAGHGARTLALSALDAVEAVTLLVAMLGAKRVESEPAAVAELVKRYAHLPLALRTAAVELAARPREPIATYLAADPGLGLTPRIPLSSMPA
jgi:DNA-binding SARP family transcriptional activator